MEGPHGVSPGERFADQFSPQIIVRLRHRFVVSGLGPNRDFGNDRCDDNDTVKFVTISECDIPPSKTPLYTGA